MIQDIYTSDNEQRKANKAGVLLARTRYLEQLAPFVKNSTERLKFVEPEIVRIIKECSETANADEQYVESHLRRIITEEITAAPTEAVSNPEKEKLEFSAENERGYNGGPPSPPLKYDPAQVNPEPDAETDLSYHQGPVIEDQIREPDLVHDLGADSQPNGPKGLGVESPHVKSSIEKHSPYGVPKDKGGDSPANDSKMEDCVEKVMAKGHSKESAIKICKTSIFGDKKSCVRCSCDIEDGVVCSNCNLELVRMANPLMGPPQVLPGQTPMQNTQSGYCPSCNQPITTSLQEHYESSHPDEVLNIRNQNPSMPGGMYPSYMGGTKEGQLPGEPQMAPQPAAPAQMPQPQDQSPQFGQEPVKVDQGLSSSPREQFDSVVSELANKAAAVQFSKPTDEEISMISQQYGLDEGQIRQNLKVVAKFGESVAVNGELNGDDSTLNMSEVDLQGMGGRVSSHKAEVPLQLAITEVAKSLGSENQDIYTALKDSFGDVDLPMQYQTNIQGDHRFYLPDTMIGTTNTAMPSQSMPSPYPPDNTQSDLQSQPAH